MSHPSCLGRLRRPWALALALLLAMVPALAPTLSHAIVWARGDIRPLVEVCTLGGPRWVALAFTQNAQPDAAGTTEFQTDSPDGPVSALGLDHCPFCLLSADRVAPPPHVMLHNFAVVVASGEPTLQPALIVRQPRPTAYPRGPPVFS